jgi:hypothetical protein
MGFGGGACERFKTPGKPVKAPFRGSILTGGVIQHRLQAQFVKPAAEDTPGTAY